MRKVDTLILDEIKVATLSLDRPNAPAIITLEETYEDDRFTLSVPVDWFVDDVKVKKGRKVIKFRKYKSDLESDTNAAASF